MHHTTRLRLSRDLEPRNLLHRALYDIGRFHSDRGQHRLAKPFYEQLASLANSQLATAEKSEIYSATPDVDYDVNCNTITLDPSMGSARGKKEGVASWSGREAKVKSSLAAKCLESLGYSCYSLGRFAEAARHYEAYVALRAGVEDFNGDSYTTEGQLASEQSMEDGEITGTGSIMDKVNDDIEGNTMRKEIYSYEEGDSLDFNANYYDRKHVKSAFRSVDVITEIEEDEIYDCREIEDTASSSGVECSPLTPRPAARLEAVYAQSSKHSRDRITSEDDSEIMAPGGGGTKWFPMVPEKFRDKNDVCENNQDNRYSDVYQSIDDCRPSEKSVENKAFIFETHSPRRVKSGETLEERLGVGIEKKTSDLIKEEASRNESVNLDLHPDLSRKTRPCSIITPIGSMARVKHPTSTKGSCFKPHEPSSLSIVPDSILQSPTTTQPSSSAHSSPQIAHRSIEVTVTSSTNPSHHTHIPVKPTRSATPLDHRLSRVFNNLGLAYKATQNFRSAITTHRRCLALAHRHCDFRVQVTSLSCIGECQYAMGNSKEAMLTFQQQLQVAQQSNGEESERHALMAISYGNIGVSLRKLGFFLQLIKWY